ncbi:hypothetical protein [Nocardioides maradonensis]
MTLPDASVLSQGADAGGVVNFTLNAAAPGGGSAAFAFSRRLVTSSVDGVTREAVTDPSEPVTRVVGGLRSTASPVTVSPLSNLTLTLGRQGSVGTGTTGAMVATAAVPARNTSVPVENSAIAGAFPKNCIDTLVHDYGNRPALVNASGSLFRYATTDFTYSQGAESTVGVGFSLSGDYGSFKLSGTASTSSTFAEGFPAKTSGYYGRRSWFNVRVYKVFCYSTRVSQTHYETRSVWAGGASTYAFKSTPTARYCTFQERGSSPTSGTSASETWSGGLSAKAAIGINLSIKTGFSKEAVNAFHFSRSGRLCGVDSVPAQTPHILIAKPPRR